MSDALKLFDAGYTDLVSVVPPGADVSPNSAISGKDLGKVPGKKGSKGWYGYNFVADGAQPTRKDVAKWVRWGSNIGTLARAFPAIDIDVQSPALRDFVLKLAGKWFGDAPVRASRHPRALLMYRTSEPFARMALAATHRGKSHLIEVLAGDRQYLIEGTHPSGKAYAWDRPLPPPSELPEITAEKALRFLGELAGQLRAKGLEVHLIGDGEVREANAPPQETLMAPSIAALRDLMAGVPNDADVAPTWEDWILVGHAIKAAAGGDPEGEAIFLDWTARCSRLDPADEDEATAQYSRMRAPHRVGWPWLQELAEDHSGGDYSAAQDDFAGSIDPEAKAPKAKEEVGVPEHLNDEGVVAWLLPRLRDQLRFAPASKFWYAWRGHRWDRDGIMHHERVVRRHLKQLCALLRLRAEAAPGKEGLPLLQAANAYQSAAKIEGITKLLRAHLACSPSDFDPNPWVLNTPGGVVDLRTGEIEPCTPSQMHARSTLVAPEPGPMPLWEQFLEDATGGDAELVRFLQLMLGYSLTGDMSEKALWYAWGSESDTGKSTLIRTVTQLWGDYADSVSPDVFMRSRADRIPAELARMPGVRLVTATEPEMGRTWDEQKVKGITGGDTLEVRFLHGQPFTYRPQFKICVVGNSEPELRHIDSAMLRRIHIVPINVPVARDKQIADLSERMVQEEGQAILAWLIKGCLAWQAEGLTNSAAVARTTQAYAQDEDILGQWAREDCEVHSSYEATRHELYVAWTNWCNGRGEEPGKFKAFRRVMRGIQSRYGLKDALVGDRRLSGYRGIRLRSEVLDGTEFNV